MEYIHASDPASGDGTSEEVTTENGAFKYWRTAVPLPRETKRLFKKRQYHCDNKGCGKSFDSYAAYEYHYTKAAEEEIKFNEKI